MQSVDKFTFSFRMKLPNKSRDDIMAGPQSRRFLSISAKFSPFSASFALLNVETLPCTRFSKVKPRKNVRKLGENGYFNKRRSEFSKWFPCSQTKHTTCPRFHQYFTLKKTGSLLKISGIFDARLHTRCLLSNKSRLPPFAI